MSGCHRVIYKQCGVRLRSEVELPFPVAAGDHWDVDIRWSSDIADAGDTPPGEIIAEFERSSDDWWYRATSVPEGYLIRFSKRGEFIISSDLSTILVRHDPAGNAAFLPVLMAGTVLAFLLTLRGQTVLHASAVAVDGTALAFVGQSGRGKSTIAALMCLDGATLVTDDVLVVEAGPPVTAIGGSTELRLRPASTSLADIRSDAPRRMTADERLALTLDPSPIERLPLAAIVIPAPSRTAREIEVVRLAPSTALFALLSFPRIQGWRLPDVLSRDFTVQSEVVNQIPVYDVRIPWGPPFDPSVAQSLRALVFDAVQGDDAATASR